MKITLISNYFNHHQKSMSDVLFRLTKGQFTFIATQKISEMRKALGYKEITADYVVSVPPERYEQLVPLIDESDVLIAGSAPESMLKKHICSGKLFFRYSERPLKNGRELLKYLWRYIRWHWNNPSKGKIYMLCASAYTAKDYASFGLFVNKTYKWGYFPETVYYEDPKRLMADKKANKLLWCGRFLDWKHPDDVLRIARKLKEDGYNFEIDFIGTGEIEADLQKLKSIYELEDYVRFQGPMPTETVRMHMEEAGIFLFTSDRKEGWGAVLNESMNSGCAVVASDAAGASPFLVIDGKNGFLYRSGDVDMLYEKVKYLLDHPEDRKQMGLAAYETITTEWNAQVAGERFCRLAQSILDGEVYPDLYERGPCSKV